MRLGDEIESIIPSFLKSIVVYDCFPGQQLSRFGSKNDGGYVFNPHLYMKKLPDLISIGVGDNADFEKDYFAFSCGFGFGANIFLFDPYIEEPTLDFPGTFFPCPAEQLVFKRFERDSILKMDIEGDEWDFFAQIPEEILRQYSQIICEFHFLHLVSPAGSSPYFERVYKRFQEKKDAGLFHFRFNVLKKLFSYFYPYHIHANNSLPKINIGGFSFPPLIELSMARKNLIKMAPEPTNKKFPLSLDRPNKPDRPDILEVYPLCS